jgi:asparagine synthase (glutamine-hydrolysing)
MCGIFLILSKNNYFTSTQYQQFISSFYKIKHRGPDDSQIIIANNSIMGFHRLSINDLSPNGMQPFININKLSNNQTFTMCNGEIYNYHELLKNNPDILPLLKSKSDCEILPHLYHKYGFFSTVNNIDGVFATCYVTKNYIQIVTDKIGVKPLFYAEDNNFFAVASEAKALDQIFSTNQIHRLEPATILTYNKICNTKFFDKYWSIYDKQHELIYDDFETAVLKIHNILIKSVQKRMTSDREIGCLLSGGLDSSCVAAILSKEMKKQGKKLTTFSVGFPDSTDLKFAREVAQFIDSDHQELVINYNDALQEIPEVIKMIETYDTTTIRASTPMYMLCKWINTNFPHKVIFSGEGSDEIFGGYLYFHNAPSPIEGHKDTLRLINELYKYDVLRADRSTAGNGLEFREPFLDSQLIDYVSTLNPDHKIPKKGAIEKILLRTAFTDYLPESIVWRVKQAFSDAVSNPSVKPWYKYIHEYAEKQHKNNYNGTDESNWYKTIFHTHFNNYNPNVSLWLPKWTDVGEEPSATVLNVYTNDSI